MLNLRHSLLLADGKGADPIAVSSGVAAEMRQLRKVCTAPPR